jgi:hypothetical protein
MAVRIIEGVPGAGKTYFAVNHLLASYFDWNDVLDEYKPKPDFDRLLIISNIDGFPYSVSLTDLLEKHGGLENFFTYEQQASLFQDRKVIYLIDEAQGLFQSVAVGDFNLDGKPDLATANTGSNNVTILLNTCSNAPPTDTLPPVITLRPVIELGPPDHKYHIITIAQMVQSVSDDSDGNLFNNVFIEKVTSDEPDDASRKADGTTINDIVIAGDCKSVRL